MEDSLRARGISRETIIMGALLLLVPLTLVADRIGWPSWIVFFFSVGAVIPLAAFIGWATEGLAERFGGKIGGLLNATFGNAPDLLVGVFGVQRGLIPLVKATIVGALISNSALIMGLCYLFAGLAHGRPRFRREEAGHHSVLMMLTVAAVVFPSVGARVACPGGACRPGGPSIFDISVGVAIVLLLAYAAYVVYGIFGIERLGASESAGRDTRVIAQQAASDPVHAWPLWLSLAILGIATVALIPVTDILTASVGPVTDRLGWTQVFVGMIIVANAGNMAEAYAAIKFALQKRAAPVDEPNGDSGLDLSLGIASASSVQIATFVMPLIVLYSFTGERMTLVFSPVELSILAILAVIFAHIGHDGESNWLEGAELLALYAMAAIIFYALPVSAFQ